MATLYEFALEALYYARTHTQAHRGAGVRAQAGVEPGIEQVFGANRCSMTEQVFGFPESGESPLPCNIEQVFPSESNRRSILDLGGSTAPPHSLPAGLPAPRWGGNPINGLEAVRMAVWPSESKWGVCPPTGAPSGATTCELFQRGTGVRSHQPATHAP